MRQAFSFNRLLGATVVFVVMLIISRVIYSGTLTHVFLIWNIFLAWIPYILSCYFISYLKKQHWKQAFIFFSWLLFFPNALYIITDLIHLQDSSSAPVWFDAILLFTSSLIGLLMAFMSLHHAEKYLQRIFSQKIIHFMIPGIIVLGSFGVYLGRFQRWNSWDIIHNPLALGADIMECFISPEMHIRTWGITMILSVLFYLIYGFSKILPHSFQQNKNAAQ